MATTTRRRRPSVKHPPPRPTAEQFEWIRHRDVIGEVIDRYLAADPAPCERLAIALIEDSLRRGDRAVGLT